MNDKIIKKEHLFFIGLLFYVLRNFFAYTSYPVPNSILNIFWFITQSSWIFAMVMRWEFNGRVIVEVILLIFGYINLKITGSWNMLSLFFMLFASKGIEVKKIINLMFKVSAVLLSVNIAWYTLNYLLGRVTISQMREVDGEIILRHNFYFNHANGLSLYIFFVVLMFMYLYYEKINKSILYLVLLISALFIYSFPNTRTIALLFLIVMLLDLPKRKTLDMFVCKICRHMYIIGFILIIVLVYLFVNNSNAIVLKINDAMNGRLTLVAGAFQLYGVNLQGHKIINEEVFLPSLGYFKLYIDNFYGMLVIRYGLLATFIVSFFAICTSKSLYKQNKRLVLILLSIVFIFGLSESTALDIFPVFPWLFFKETNLYKKYTTKR